MRLTVNRRGSSEPRPARGSSLVAWCLDLGEDAYALLECPGPPTAAAVLTRLTAAERQVARVMAQGLTNAEIARSRGSATRTVANQAASIFRKLGVKSRLELGALLARGVRARP